MRLRPSQVRILPGAQIAKPETCSGFVLFAAAGGEKFEGEISSTSVARSMRDRIPILAHFGVLVYNYSIMMVTEWNLPIVRFCLLLGLAITIHCSFFLTLAYSTATKYVVDVKADGDLLQSEGMSLEDFENRAGFLFKMPVKELNFWIYARNGIFCVATTTPWIFPTFLNIDINGQYTNHIPTDTSKRIYDQTLRDKNRVPEHKFSRSVYVANFGPSLVAPQPCGGGSYAIYIWPTWPSFLFSFFISVGIAYGLLVFLAGWWNFVWYAHPFKSQ